MANLCRFHLSDFVSTWGPFIIEQRVEGGCQNSGAYHAARRRQVRVRCTRSAFCVRKTVTLSLGVLKNGVFDEEDEVIEPFDDLPATRFSNSDTRGLYRESGSRSCGSR